jgi:hypothetical protein
VRTAIAGESDSSTWEAWWKQNSELFVDVRGHASVRQGTPLSGDAVSVRPNGTQAVAIAAPVLMRVLQEESNPELLRAALIALGRVDGPLEGPLARWDDDLDALLASFLAHGQESVAEAAALALGIRGREAGARILEEVLVDGPAGQERVARTAVPRRLRAFAAFGLGLCAQRTASEDVRRWIVHALVASIEGKNRPDPDLEGAVVAALGLSRLETYSAYFERVVSFKRELLNAADRMPATAARVALVADLFNVLADDERSTSARAQVPTAIANVIQGTDETLRGECVREFVRISRSSPKEREIVAGIMLALGTIVLPIDTPHDRDARALLVHAARTGERSAQGFALISLGRVAHAAWLEEEHAVALELENVLVDVLEHGRSGTTGWAAMGLGLCGDAHHLLDPERANQALRRLLASDRNQSASNAAALALGLRGDKGAVESVRARVFATGEDEVRGRYALALGLLDDCDVRADLRELVAVSAQRPALLREVVTSLALLDDEEITAVLIEAFANAPTQAAQSAYVEALALVGDARALPPLAALATSDKASLGGRIHAVRALAAVGDADRARWNAPFAFNAQYLAACDVLISDAGTGVLDLR